MTAQTVKAFADTFGFSDEAVSAILSHLNEYAEDNNLTVLKKTKQVVTFSYENKIRCKFGSVETKNEQVVFIPGEGYVSTIVVAMKMKAEETQPVKDNNMNEEQKKNVEALLEQCAAVDTEIKVKTSTAPLVAKLSKAAAYLAAATAIGFGGYYLYKKLAGQQTN